MEKLRVVLQILIEEESLPLRCHDHALTGKWTGYRDCHIEPDWLLIYGIEGNDLVLVRTGIHADLFRWNASSWPDRSRRTSRDFRKYPSERWSRRKLIVLADPADDDGTFPTKLFILDDPNVILYPNRDTVNE